MKHQQQQHETIQTFLHYMLTLLRAWCWSQNVLLHLDRWNILDVSLMSQITGQWSQRETRLSQSKLCKPHSDSFCLCMDEKSLIVIMKIMKSCLCWSLRTFSCCLYTLIQLHIKTLKSHENTPNLQNPNRRATGDPPAKITSHKPSTSSPSLWNTLNWVTRSHPTSLKVTKAVHAKLIRGLQSCSRRLTASGAVPDEQPTTFDLTPFRDDTWEPWS